MKIAFFTETYHPQTDGVVRTIDLYKRELEKRGHEVYIFAPGPGKKEKNVIRFRSFKFRPYPEYRVSIPSGRLIKETREIRPDIIHLHGPATAGMMGLSMAKMMHIPVVATYHTHLEKYSDFLTKRAEKTGKRLIRRYVRWFHNRVDANIGLSTSIKRDLRRYGVRKPIYLIPTGVEYTVRSYKIKKKNKTPIILHVGRICKEKEIDVVIKEFQKLKKGKLIITSRGPYEKNLKQLVKKIDANNIEFTGYASDKTRDQLYTKADVFVCASSTETLGLVALEAMSYGCPVIVRNAGGFKDIVKNNYNGLLFNKDSELHKKIEKLLKNEELRKKIIKNGYKKVDGYSIKHTIDEIEKLYTKLIK